MNVGIIGLGLIGGSIGLASVKCGKYKVYGYDKNPSVIAEAQKIKAIDFVLSRENIRDCDLIIFSVFPKDVCKMISELAPLMKNGAIVSDIAGVKHDITSEMKLLSEKFPTLKFISMHPMAGREVSGLVSAKADLFKNCFVISVNVSADSLAEETIANFYKSLGAVGIEKTTAENHDKMISYTSQLAHIVSSSYIKNKLSEKHVGYSAGSFQDMTRVAKLNPTMWTELCLENKANLVEQIEDLVENLEKFKTALEKADGKELFELFEEASKAKKIADESLKEKLENDNRR